MCYFIWYNTFAEAIKNLRWGDFLEHLGGPNIITGVSVGGGRRVKGDMIIDAQVTKIGA